MRVGRIPTITRPSVTAMVALGVTLGTVIGFERRPVPERQAALPPSLVFSFNDWT
jgi:hypothetical protein